MAISLPTATQVQAKLKSTFGFAEFRPLQEEILRAILDGRDVFVLMPTGGGKSLCYQLPALLLDGLAVVVSPLIALMKDQVDALQALGVAATCINSSVDRSEIGRRQAAVARGELKLLYVAPERLMTAGFLHLLSTVKVAFFAIDEAHCISEWGHDFRPEYRELARLRELFPTSTLAAFTATATRRVRSDIAGQLGLKRAASFRGSFNRPNLYYEVRPKQAAYRQLTDYLAERGAVSGIIYCRTRADTDALAARLQADGFSATSYHAGLQADDRRRRQEAFVRDDTRIIVETIAFGMGIDKPDVRFVAHFDVPKNLEGFYQESGRAGRDGLPSDCLLFFDHGDADRLRWFIKQKPSPLERQVALQQLRQMVDWAEARSCRRRALLAYFDEQLAGQARPCCDVCRESIAGADCTIAAQKLLSCARRTGERFGSAYLIDVLRGSRNERIVRNGHDRLPTHGIGRDNSKDEWRHLAAELLRGGYISQTEDDLRVVKVTERGRAVLFQGERVVLAPAQPAAPPPAAAAAPARHPLFDRLAELRKRLADDRGIPPYVIFEDVTLELMAIALPTRPEDLLCLDGATERKVLDYGDEFLSLIAEYAARGGAGAPATPRPWGWQRRRSTRAGSDDHNSATARR